MIRSRWWMVVAMAGLGAVVVWAAAQTGAQQPETGQIPTFQANANLVLVDVVVRDKGKPVQGLKESDFQIFEDGKPQAITTFEEHRATEVQDAAKAPPLPPHVYSDFPKYKITSAANVLLLDALNTPLGAQGNAREQMLKVLHTIPPGTEIAVFTLASRLRMVSGFTTDAGAIEQALSLVHTPKRQSLVSDPAGDITERQVETEMKGEMGMMVLGVDEWEQDRHTYQTEQRADMTLAAFSQLARYLSTVPERKNLIWVSGGLAGALDPTEIAGAKSALMPDLVRPNATEEEHRLPAARKVNAELAWARVAVYPVDARALMTLTDSDIANVVAPTEMGTAKDLQVEKAEAGQNDIQTPQEWGESQQEMKLIAENTGGEAFYNTNAIGKAVVDAIADGSNYYTLAYAPHEAENGAYHTIAVRLDEGKYELEYRRGYYALAASEETPMLSPMTEAMETGAPPLSQLIFEARVLAAGDPALDGVQPTPGPAGKPTEPLTPPVTRYIVDYSIDPRGLELKTLPYGGKQAELEVTQAVYEAGGKRVNSTDAGLEVTQTAEEVARDMQNGLRVRQEIDVPAGNVVLRLGVRDATSGRIGTVEIRP